MTNGNIENLASLLEQVEANALTFPWGNVRDSKYRPTPRKSTISRSVSSRELGWGTVIEASRSSDPGAMVGRTEGH